MRAAVPAAFTDDGTNELDAAVMVGAQLESGRWSRSYTTVQASGAAGAPGHGQKTRHVLLAAHGAEDARARGTGLESSAAGDTFSASAATRRCSACSVVWPQNRDADCQRLDRSRQTGTVGAVALDLNGNLAAATSIGRRNNN
jgi:beta-aspartyl-peptidase (threonine type)